MINRLHCIRVLYYLISLYRSQLIQYRRQIENIFFIFPENMLQHFMQIVSLGDNLHDMLKPIFWKKKSENYFRLSSAEIFTQHAVP